jgi:hypothetical protein
MRMTRQKSQSAKMTELLNFKKLGYRILCEREERYLAIVLLTFGRVRLIYLEGNTVRDGW